MGLRHRVARVCQRQRRLVLPRDAVLAHMCCGHVSVRSSVVHGLFAVAELLVLQNLIP